MSLAESPAIVGWTALAVLGLTAAAVLAVLVHSWWRQR